MSLCTSQVAVPVLVAKIVFYEVTVTLTSDPWQPKSNQFILESLWTLVLSVKKSPRCNLELSHDCRWHGGTTSLCLPQLFRKMLQHRFAANVLRCLR